MPYLAIDVHETLAERVATVVRQHIVELRPGFEPGQRINVAELAGSLGVSPTPVKEGLKKLEANGLVRVEPRRGVFVSRISREDMEEILTIRAGLEVLAVRLRDGPWPAHVLDVMATTLDECERSLAGGDDEAYHQADLRFHRLLVEASESPRLVRLYGSLLDQWQVMDGYCPRLNEDTKVSMSEHQLLLRLAREGETARLEAELWAHWERGKSRLLERYRRFLSDDGTHR
jgi:DNA-binding GntR family transcriptional regulator